jgi:hypothetical protein
VRLTGFEAIEYGEKQRPTLNKHPDSLSGTRVNLSIGEAEAVAAGDPNLICLDVAESDYYSGPPTSYGPEPYSKTSACDSASDFFRAFSPCRQ